MGNVSNLGNGNVGWYVIVASFAITMWVVTNLLILWLSPCLVASRLSNFGKHPIWWSAASQALVVIGFPPPGTFTLTALYIWVAQLHPQGSIAPRRCSFWTLGLHDCPSECHIVAIQDRALPTAACVFTHHTATNYAVGLWLANKAVNKCLKRICPQSSLCQTTAGTVICHLLCLVFWCFV